MNAENPRLFDVHTPDPVLNQQRAAAGLDLLPPRLLGTEITLRDLFSAFALDGILSGALVLGVAKVTKDGEREGVIAEMAYRHADAMLTERAKRAAP